MDIKRIVGDNIDLKDPQFRKFLDDVYNSCKCPNFRVGRSAVQAIANNTTTVVQFNVDSTAAPTKPSYWDYINGWNTSTYRFNPQVPGVYHVGMKCTYSYSYAVTASQTLRTHILKNGSGFSQTDVTGIAIGAGNIMPTLFIADNVYLDGINDYIEFAVFHTTGVSMDLSNNAQLTQAWGYKLQY